MISFQVAKRAAIWWLYPAAVSRSQPGRKWPSAPEAGPSRTPGWYVYRDDQGRQCDPGSANAPRTDLRQGEDPDGWAEYFSELAEWELSTATTDNVAAQEWPQEWPECNQ